MASRVSLGSPPLGRTDGCACRREGGTRATACVWSKRFLGVRSESDIAKTPFLLYKNLMHASVRPMSTCILLPAFC